MGLFIKKTFFCGCAIHIGSIWTITFITSIIHKLQFEPTIEGCFQQSNNYIAKVYM